MPEFSRTSCGPNIRDRGGGLTRQCLIAPRRCLESQCCTEEKESEGIWCLDSAYTGDRGGKTPRQGRISLDQLWLTCWFYSALALPTFNLTLLSTALPWHQGLLVSPKAPLIPDQTQFFWWVWDSTSSITSFLRLPMTQLSSQTCSQTLIHSLLITHHSFNNHVLSPLCVPDVLGPGMYLECNLAPVFGDHIAWLDRQPWKVALSKPCI